MVWIQNRELGGGQVVAAPARDGGEWWYRVRFQKRVETMVEDYLEPLGKPDQTPAELAVAGKWGNIDAFRQVVVVERFQQRKDDRSTLYSFRNQKILFAPHQYKPLLKLLESADRKLLIADEVGLGKTIEAGLILAELRARLNIARVLIVCPSRLREKWHLEMLRKFGFDFEIFGRREIDAWLDKHREDPRPRALHAIVSLQSMRPEDLRERFLAESPGLDLVIVDEAHHARNAGTLTSQLIQGLGGITDAMLLLTATPIQLGNQDLFTLLHALRPGDYTNYEVFHADLQRHVGVRKAVQLLRRRDPQTLRQVAEHLRSTFAQRDGRVLDPMAAHMLEELGAHPPKSLRDWLEFEHAAEDLHILAPILTRTRKRDVQEHAPVRRSYVHECQWSESERRAYCELLGIDDDSAWPRTGMHLGLVQRARQAASCLPAAIAAAGAAARPDAWDDMMDFDQEEAEALPPGTPPTVRNVRIRGDAKLAKLFEILRTIDREEPREKVLLFTYFVGTSHYLEQQLNGAGWKTARIAGDVPSNPRHPQKDERGRIVDRFREDPDLRVLVSTEVGSEGLDFQFCHIVVNYDLPWNPMVIEQRIGRVDRFGQRSSFLGIHNLVVTGTVEERVLLRLYDRIEIFKQSLGDLEHLLGAKMGELRKEYFQGRLTATEAERRVDEVAKAIENQRKDVELLERRQGELIGHEDYIRDELERIQRLGRHLGGGSLRCVLEGFLQKRHRSATVRPLDDGTFMLDIDAELCGLVGLTVGTDGESEMNQLQPRSPIRFTFDGQLAFEQAHTGLVLLNPEHPLIRTALRNMIELLDDAHSRVSCAAVPADDALQHLVGETLYLASFRQEVRSARSRSHLVAVGWTSSSQRLLGEDEAERLLHLVAAVGMKIRHHEAVDAMPQAAWESMLGAARKDTRTLEAKEKRENSARVERRRQQISAEGNRKIAIIEQRIETSRLNKRGDRVLSMFEAQLIKARNEVRDKLAALSHSLDVSVTLSDPLTICAVQVVSNGEPT